MELQLTKNEKIIAWVLLGLVMSFFLMFMQINSSHRSLSQIESNTSINYQMARAEEGFSEYSLSGRDVDHVYQGLTAQAKKELSKMIAQTDVKKLAALSADAAKKQAALAQAQALAKKKQTQKSNQQKNTKTDGALAQATTTSPEASENKPTENTISQENLANIQQNLKKNTTTNETTDSQNKNKKKKTYAEWRTLLFSKPTRETLVSFIEAYKNNDVTSDEYQAMSQELLSQTDDNLKGLGLLALRSMPSLQSFSQLVHVQAQLPTTYQNYVEQAYLAYLQPQNIQVLNQALMTKDKTLVLKSLNLLGTNLQKIHQGDYTSLVDSRNKRDGSTGNNNISINVYKSLLPALISLGSSQDQDVSPLAQQVSSLIQTSNNIAQN